jgi:hypothetical protein
MSEWHAVQSIIEQGHVHKPFWEIRIVPQTMAAFALLIFPLLFSEKLMASDEITINVEYTFSPNADQTISVHGQPLRANAFSGVFDTATLIFSPDQEDEATLKFRNNSPTFPVSIKDPRIAKLRKLLKNRGKDAYYVRDSVPTIAWESGMEAPAVVGTDERNPSRPLVTIRLGSITNVETLPPISRIEVSMLFGYSASPSERHDLWAQNGTLSILRSARSIPIEQIGEESGWLPIHEQDQRYLCDLTRDGSPVPVIRTGVVRADGFEAVKLGIPLDGVDPETPYWVRQSDVVRANSSAFDENSSLSKRRLAIPAEKEKLERELERRQLTQIERSRLRLPKIPSNLPHKLERRAPDGVPWATDACQWVLIRADLKTSADAFEAKDRLDH